MLTVKAVVASLWQTVCVAGAVCAVIVGEVQQSFITVVILAPEASVITFKKDGLFGKQLICG